MEFIALRYASSELTVRKRLRNLIKLIDKTKRKIVYTDLVDEIGVASATPQNRPLPTSCFEGLFKPAEVTKLFTVLSHIRPAQPDRESRMR
jgi:hypothetical protein